MFDTKIVAVRGDADAVVAELNDIAEGKDLTVYGFRGWHCAEMKEISPINACYVFVRMSCARSNNGVQTDRAHGAKSGKKSTARKSQSTRGG